MIKFLGSFTVLPSLPNKLEPLREIIYNLHWAWNHDALELFRRMDKDLWLSSHHNPVSLVGQISQNRLEELAKDDGFNSHMNRVYVDLTTYMAEQTWYDKNFEAEEKPYVAYFSSEYGLADCLQSYSGGLGILSGDHMKSASDLGVPLIGIGLCYRQGYFQQYLTVDGWQQERYETIDFHNQPMQLVTDKKDIPIKISLRFPGRDVYFQMWKLQIGRVALYLLDTNVAENNEQDKDITKALYGGNTETRIQQEIILGIGGIRALHALDIKPSVCHMNEGHSAFLALERIKHLITEHGLSFEEAKDIGFYSNVFTTHTPVPAGIDVFQNSMVEKYFGEYYRNELGLSGQQFYELGTIEHDAPPVNFNMAHLAMNMAGYVNGVSKLHGEVSKKMWAYGFDSVPFDEIPIESITNGIHTASHISKDMHELLIRYLGEKFVQDPADKDIWDGIDDIPDEELWRTHERRRERLVAFARERLREQVIARGGSKLEVLAAKEVLDPYSITIGFARRFATYKRANLILRDIERLASLLCDADMPVQFIIAGKAHPKDDEGKRLIQDIVSAAKDDILRKKIVFIENYDMNIARYMVEGCDMWLNNPRRPMEASGTSGMKVIANGGLNFSILDGWWDEAYDRELGWKIGDRENYEDPDYQDELESNQIYETLEKEIVPIFYDRGEDKLPRKWIAMMKASMKTLGPVFNTNRMVGEYVKKYYISSLENRKKLIENDWAMGKEFTQWKKKVKTEWNKISFNNISHRLDNGLVKVGKKYEINADVILGNLEPGDVQVQIYYGKPEDKDKANFNQVVNMSVIEDSKKGNTYQYTGSIPCDKTGLFGFTLRILPSNPALINSFELGLIKWAE
ncbi:MAG: alpha-glucan family phosphorylase [Bacteroidetes bacterium]|nr:alpha-glucan family phosphorylase [Bacteroidota bacterium]